jgi:hypothetical protein
MRIVTVKTARYSASHLAKFAHFQFNRSIQSKKKARNSMIEEIMIGGMFLRYGSSLMRQFGLLVASLSRHHPLR